ncbi:MAG: ribosome biogenesis GTPase YlqF [Solobacterium sp.]|nr:ribosome biogenesis GTPase YlqF [Solobacterium sp.]
MTDNTRSINWYPGHMEKARRQMQENIKIMDMIIEVRDARIPEASANPVLNEMTTGKPRLIILSKEDLADPAETEQWVRSLSTENCIVLPLDLRDGKDVRKKIVASSKQLTKKTYEKLKAKGIRNPRPMRAMACGIPNSGKSTLINRIFGKASLKTADHPGVTKTLSWIHADPYLDILDTPGVLWPRFDDQHTAALLAVTGAINDQVLDFKEIAAVLLTTVQAHYPGLLEAAYSFTDIMDPYDILRAAAQCRHILKENSEPDLDKCAGTVIYEFRRGKLGRITLEYAEKKENLSE